MPHRTGRHTRCVQVTILFHGGTMVHTPFIDVHRLSDPMKYLPPIVPAFSPCFTWEHDSCISARHLRPVSTL